jgi:hypothetical protein
VLTKLGIIYRQFCKFYCRHEQVLFRIRIYKVATSNNPLRHIIIVCDIRIIPIAIGRFIHVDIILICIHVYIRVLIISGTTLFKNTILILGIIVNG